MTKLFIFWLPVIVWAGVIFWLSSIPDLESGLKQDFILRKIAHILEFAILTFLFLRALTKEKLSNKKIIIYSIIFVTFYALVDEYHQTFVQARQGSLRDVAVDGIGILIMAWMWYYKNKKIKGRKAH